MHLGLMNPLWRVPSFIACVTGILGEWNQPVILSYRILYCLWQAYWVNDWSHYFIFVTCDALLQISHDNRVIFINKFCFNFGKHIIYKSFLSQRCISINNIESSLVAFALLKTPFASKIINTLLFSARWW